MYCITFHSSHGCCCLVCPLPLCQYSVLFRPSSSLEYQCPLPAPFDSSDMSKNGKKKGKRKASGPATKSCNGCGRELPQDDYSKKQWGREDGACITCTNKKTRKHNADAKARAIAAKTESQRVESTPLAVDRSLAALRAPSKKELTTTVAGKVPKAAGSASAPNTGSESLLLEDRGTTTAAGSASAPNTRSESLLLEDRGTTKAAGSASAPNTGSESLLLEDRRIIGGTGGGSTTAAGSASAPNTRSESLLLEDRGTTKAAGSASAPNTGSESLLLEDRRIVGGTGGGSTTAAGSASAPNTRSESLLLEDRRIVCGTGGPECCSFALLALQVVFELFFAF